MTAPAATLLRRQPGRPRRRSGGCGSTAGCGSRRQRTNPDAAAGGGRGRGGAPTAPMAPGLNRFTWDLRYAPATSFPGMVLWGGSVTGPAALPGTYQVRLTVDGKPHDAAARR